MFFITSKKLKEISLLNFYYVKVFIQKQTVTRQVVWLVIAEMRCNVLLFFTYFVLLNKLQSDQEDNCFRSRTKEAGTEIEAFNRKILLSHLYSFWFYYYSFY